MTKPQPNIKCTNCGYAWNTKSKLILISCPSCKHNIKNTTLTKLKLKCLKDTRMSIENMEQLGTCWGCDQQEHCRSRLTRSEQLYGAIRLADSALKKGVE